jgi:hypothetical protein
VFEGTIELRNRQIHSLLSTRNKYKSVVLAGSITSRDIREQFRYTFKGDFPDVSVSS